MITSVKNDLVKYIDKLQKSTKMRREEDVFIAEGIRIVSEIPPERLERIIISESFFEKNRDIYDKITGSLTKNKIKNEIVSDTVYKHMSDTETPQGIMAVAKQFHYSLEDLLINKNSSENNNPLLVILENIQNPGNLGTILRSSEAAGATGVVLSSDCADIYNSKVIRGSMGSILRIPFVYAENLPAFIRKLKEEKEIACYAAALSGSVDYTVPEYTLATAFIIGNEGNGLTEETIKSASKAIRIPMEGRAESLNAGIAASVFLYEAHRQRNQK